MFRVVIRRIHDEAMSDGKVIKDLKDEIILNVGRQWLGDIVELLRFCVDGEYSAIIEKIEDSEEETNG